MKKIKCLLLVILFIPFIVLAETKNVEIKNISNYVDKSDTAEELEKPSIEGLKLGFKLEFTKQDDFIKYKFIIKNNTDKDYEIDDSSTFNEKKFIRYIIKSSDQNSQSSIPNPQASNNQFTIN